MNICVLKTGWILLCVFAATAQALPYGRVSDNYADEQKTRGMFAQEAFVLSKRGKAHPSSVSRLSKMHSIVGIGKRGSLTEALVLSKRDRPTPDSVARLGRMHATVGIGKRDANEAFVLSKRDRPTPDSVARLGRMHATVGIGKRDANEAFVLSKRDRPTPDSVARLGRMHATVGIGKRDANDVFFKDMSKPDEASSSIEYQGKKALSSVKSTGISGVNSNNIASDVSPLYDVIHTCTHALKYVAESSGKNWKEGQLKDLLNRCLQVALLARKFSPIS